jgi:hypothetical protein
MRRSVGRHGQDRAGSAADFYNFRGGTDFRLGLIHRRPQNLKKHAAMDAKGEAGRIVQLRETMPAVGPGMQASQHRAARRDLIEQAHPAQDSLPRGLEQKTRADRTELRGALEQDDMVARARQEHSQRTTSDAEADDADG